MPVDFTQGRWINPPARSRVAAGSVQIVTDPGTDFWQGN
jgi:regulation of enolase protein 1 (concanavalin A-like superfamily)